MTDAPRERLFSIVRALGASDDAVHGHVDRVERFTIEGWASSLATSLDVRLVQSGADVPTVVARCARADVHAALGFVGEDAGFLVDVPASVWSTIPPEQACELEIRSLGSRIGRAVEITRHDVLNWAEEVARLPEDPETPYRVRLAVDHVTAANVASRLDSGARGRLQWLASRHGVDPSALTPRKSRAELSLEAARSVDDELLAEAMHDLSARLVRSEDPIAALDATRTVHPLSGAARLWFDNIAIQLACERGALDRVDRFVDLGRFAESASRSEIFALSLLLPVLLRLGRHADAAESLGAIAGLVESSPPLGWLETNCLRSAFVVLHADEDAGTVTSELAARLRSTFVRILRGLDARRDERLDDEQLVRTAADLLLRTAKLPDDEAAYLSRSFVSLYGLRPSFHAALGAGPSSTLEHVVRCQDAFRALSESLESWGRGDASRLVKAVDWFVRHDVNRADIVLRQVATAILADGSSLDPRMRDALLERWLETADVDRVRLAASPMIPVAAKWITPDAVLAYVAKDSGLAVSPTRSLERRCIAELLELERSLAEGVVWDGARLAFLLDTATLLCDAQANHLGLDILATTYRHLVSTPVSRIVFARLRDALLRTLDRLAPSVALSAPLWSTWSRLSDSGDEGRGRALAAEIARRLGSDRFALPTADPHCDDPSPASSPGWVDDVLVVVRSGERDTIDRALDDDLGLDVEFIRSEHVLGLFASLASLARRSKHRYFLVVDPSTFVARDRLVDLTRLRRHHVHGRLLDQRIDLKAGIFVSRFAVERILAVSRTIAGQRLAQAARAEGRVDDDFDALVTLAGFMASDEEAYRLRRERGHGPDGAVTSARTTGAPVAITARDLGFFPGPSSPTTLVHLATPRSSTDGAEAQTLGRARLDPTLHPKTIWPADVRPGAHERANPLELVSGGALLGRLHAEDRRTSLPLVVSVMRNERLLVPHFLDHYRRLGVSGFIVVDNASTDGTREYLVEQEDVVLYSCCCPYRGSRFGVVWQETVLASHGLGRWVIVADADEFFVFEGCEDRSLVQYVATLERDGSDAVLVGMVDMYPAGELASADFTKQSPFAAAPFFDRAALTELAFGGGHFSNSRNFVSALRHRIAPSRINSYVSQKIAMVRYLPWMRFSEGLHYAANTRVHPEPAYFAHFKYHAGFAAKVAVEVKRNQHFNGAEEYRRYETMLEERRGGFDDASRSARYVDSTSFAGLIPTRRG